MKRPAFVALVAAGVIAAGAFGIAQTRIDARPERYLFGSEVWTEYEQIDARYGISETVVVALRELGGTVFDVETVSAVAAVDRALSSLPGVQRVLSIASATAIDRENEALDLTPLLPAGPITKETAIQLAGRIQRHPVYGQALVDGPYETTFVFVQLTPDSSIDRVELAREIRRLADTFATKHRTVHIAGTLMLKEAIGGAIAHDLLIYIPLSLALLVLLLWLAFGELVAGLVPLSVVLLATFSTLGAFAALSIPLTLSTAIVPILVVLVGLAETVHFLSELRWQHTRTDDRDVSLTATVRALAAPSLVTCLAIAAMLLTLVPSPIGPVRELGLAGAVGVVVVHASTMILTPMLLRAFEFPRRQAEPLTSAAQVGRGITAFALGARRRLVPTIASIGLAFGVVTAAGRGVRLEQDFVAYLPEDHRLRVDMAIIDRTLGGVDTLEMILDGAGPGVFKQTEELARLERLGKRLEKSDGIHTAFSLADYLKIANAVLLGAPEGEDRLPSTPEAVAQLTVIDPTPFEAFTDPEMRQARLALQTHAMSSSGVKALAQRIRQKAAPVLQGSDISVRLTGLPMVFAQVIDLVAADAARRIPIALFFAWVVLIIGFGSVATPCVTMVPVVLTGAFTLAAMSLIGLDLDIVGVFLAPLAFALSMSHAVHLADRYQGARASGSPTSEAALTYAAIHGGHPIFLVSLLAAIGFSLLGMSSFTATVYVAKVGLLFSLIAGALHLFVSPVLLMLADWLENRHAEPAPTRADPLAAADFRRVSTVLTTRGLPPRDHEPSRPSRSGAGSRQSRA